jgi:hypothetical protein
MIEIDSALCLVHVAVAGVWSEVPSWSGVWHVSLRVIDFERHSTCGCGTREGFHSCTRVVVQLVLAACRLCLCGEQRI